ncbi:hypothetical protein HNR42_003186 [Deinobacterium chartae]|uniref:Lipoprotein n=1 Tax=Deinobacterium chartae TaxID=521158 RepID=A0A841I5K7_9DEIO|nr:hypothetical protein [Deinobacterium chartae]MBB6099728.1 hypothetical protein [Deinobacterium chartae]
MKKTSFAALLFLAPLVAGCGALVGSFVPPQTFNNPANLDGAQLSSSSALQPAAVKGTLSYDTSKTTPPSPFDDLKYPDNVPFGIRPHAMKLEASFTRAVVSGSCTFPNTINLTVKSFSATVSDANGSATLTTEPNLSLTLTKAESSLTSATYTFAAHRIAVAANASTTDQAIRVLTTGGQNHASASAQVLADQDQLAGCYIRFTLGETALTLSNFS